MSEPQYEISEQGEIIPLYSDYPNEGTDPDWFEE